MVWVKVTFSDFPAFPVKILINTLDHRVAREISDRSCFLDFFSNLFTSILWLKRKLVLLGSKNGQNFKNSQRWPESILRPKLVGERTFHKYKQLCKPRARFEDPAFELMYIYIHFIWNYSLIKGKNIYSIQGIS